MAIIYFAAVQCTAVLTNRMQHHYVSILRFLVHKNAILNKLQFLPDLSFTFSYTNFTNLCLKSLIGNYQKTLKLIGLEMTQIEVEKFQSSKDIKRLILNLAWKVDLK